MNFRVFRPPPQYSPFAATFGVRLTTFVYLYVWKPRLARWVFRLSYPYVSMHRDFE